MHRTGKVLLLMLCLVQLAAQIGAQSGAGVKPAQAKTAGYPEDSYGSYSHQKSGKGPYKEEEDVYDHKEGFYGCENGCPNPQPADTVGDAYITHHTFTYAHVAKKQAEQQLVNNGAQSGRKAGNSIVRHLPARKPNQQKAAAAEARKAAAAAPSPTTKDLSAYLDQKKVEGAVPTAGKAGLMSQPAVAASAGAEAHPAGVNNAMFMLPTSEEETGRGFQGVVGDGVPTDQALAVGPHPLPEHKDTVLVVHAVQDVMKVFSASKFGTLSNTSTPAAININDILHDMGFSNDLTVQNPTAFYDKKDKRFVVTWGTAYATPQSNNGEVPAPLLVCVSKDDNPLLDWTCWALDATLESQPSVPFCTDNALFSYVPDYAQSSYSDDGVFVTIRGACISNDDPEGDNNSYLSAVFAFSKKTLYTTPSKTNVPAPRSARYSLFKEQVYRATYLTPSSWFFSLPAEDQLLDCDDGLNAFNTYVLPARPQSAKDCSEPHFVMGKVNGNRYMSIAKLTHHSLEKMTSRDNAPRVYAAILHKPDFTNQDDAPEGLPEIRQPPIDQSTPSLPLDAGDVGDAGRTYGATFHKGRLYIATSEFFGPRNTRVPSIYYAIVDPSAKLCDPHVDRWGVVASEDRYALAYPSIGARLDGAVLCYSYGSDEKIYLDGVSYPAYAGLATSVVACDDRHPMITIAKRGEDTVEEIPGRKITVPEASETLPWGQYSAADFVDDIMWCAGSVALDIKYAPNRYGSFITTEEL